MPRVTATDEQDSPWKEILEAYFEAFLAFFFPEAQAEIDWSREPVFLNQELHQLVRHAVLGPRAVDKLVRVWLRGGEEAWVLIHVEVQSHPDAGFAERMYVYNYRLFDRYHCRVASLAVLADERPSFRPAVFGYTLFGCEVSLHFPVRGLGLHRLDDFRLPPLPLAPPLDARDVGHRLLLLLAEERRTELPLELLGQQGHERLGIKHRASFASRAFALLKAGERPSPGVPVRSRPESASSSRR
jgi:hypothetical protein